MYPQQTAVCCVISGIDNSPRMAPNFAGGETKVQRDRSIYPRCPSWVGEDTQSQRPDFG